MLSRFLVALFVAAFATVSTASQVPRMHVVSIGVDTNPEKAKDLYADDAAAMLSLFRNDNCPPLYRLGTQVLLRGIDATPASVMEKIAVIEKTADDSDVTVVYCSCHGKSNDAKDDLALDLAEGILEGKQLLKELSAIPGKTILILDTCRGGSLLPQYLPDSDHKEISLLIASQEHEDSAGGTPGDGMLHGFFTNAIREGILGVADDPVWNGNGDGVVSLPELGTYASQRAKAIYPRQSAILRPESLPELSLMRFTEAERALADVSLGHDFFTPRNEWREPDVIGTDHYLVRTLSAKTVLPDPGNDANALPWPSTTITGSAPECLEGSDWMGRWKNSEDTEWREGNVEIKVRQSTMFIRFDNGSNVYLFELQFLGTSQLGGRYHNVHQTLDDKGRWVGRFVDYDRIDGVFVGDLGDKGRWDFRRVYSGTPNAFRERWCRFSAIICAL